MTENWLRAGLAGDGVTIAAIGKAVTAGATRGRRPGRWRRWRERARTLMTGADEDGSR